MNRERSTTRVAVIGGGGIGHALASLLGARPELTVLVYARYWENTGERTFTCYNDRSPCMVGRAFATDDLHGAVRGTDIVIITVPTHARHELLGKIAKSLNACALLLSWEGTGPFLNSVQACAIDRTICAGLQRSPILARIREHGTSCDLLGLRSAVVAAPLEASARGDLGKLLQSILPIRFDIAPTYRHVSLSPSNPLIHPARLYAVAEAGSASTRLPDKVPKFYGDWDDAASEVYLTLHDELARLRDALGLSRQFVSTLADRDPRPTAGEITAMLRGETRIADLEVPYRIADGIWMLNSGHRFFREDIGEGLRYMVELSRGVGVPMPAAAKITEWYDAL